MDNKKTPPRSKSQAEKFKEAAETLGADESEERFNEFLRRVGGAKPPRPKPKNSKVSNDT